MPVFEMVDLQQEHHESDHSLGLTISVYHLEIETTQEFPIAPNDSIQLVQHQNSVMFVESFYGFQDFLGAHSSNLTSESD